MKRSLLVAFVFTVGLVLGQSAFAVKGAYPTADAASFVIDYPESWTVTPAENAGDYVSLEGPTGALLYFRTIPGTEQDLVAAIEDTKTYLDENYADVEMSKAEDFAQHDLTGFYATATGTHEKDGEIRFVMGWLPLPDGTIGEIWYSAFADDTDGPKEAAAIMNSMRAP